MRPAAAFLQSPRLSDDTWLTLATCEAVVRDGGRPQPDALPRCSGNGSSRAVARTRFVHAQGTARSVGWRALGDVGGTGRFAVGAGVAMRAAALAFFLDRHSTTTARSCATSLASPTTRKTPMPEPWRWRSRFAAAWNANRAGGPPCACRLGPARYPPARQADGTAALSR